MLFSPSPRYPTNLCPYSYHMHWFSFINWLLLLPIYWKSLLTEFPLSLLHQFSSLKSFPSAYIHVLIPHHILRYFLCTPRVCFYGKIPPRVIYIYFHHCLTSHFLFLLSPNNVKRNKILLQSISDIHKRRTVNINVHVSMDQPQQPPTKPSTGLCRP